MISITMFLEPRILSKMIISLTPIGTTKMPDFNIRVILLIKQSAEIAEICLQRGWGWGANQPLNVHTTLYLLKKMVVNALLALYTFCKNVASDVGVNLCNVKS